MAGLGTYEELAAGGVDFASLLKKKEEGEEDQEDDIDLRDVDLDLKGSHESLGSQEHDLQNHKMADKNRLQKYEKFNCLF